MKRTSILAIALLAATFLFGCESMKQSYRENYCNYDGAYKLGVNDARSGKQMNEKVSVLCNSTEKAATEKGYRDGYTKYITLAPRKLEININHGNNPPSECEYPTDCPGNKQCRNRGDGVHLCLGDEPRGGYCEDSTDCSMGLICKRADSKIGKCLF